MMRSLGLLCLCVGLVSCSAQSTEDEFLRQAIDANDVEAFAKHSRNRCGQSVLDANLMEEMVCTRATDVLRYALDEGLIEANSLLPCGQSLVALASYRGETEIAKLLLQQGADPSRASYLGLNALHFALLKKRESCVALLSKHASLWKQPDALGYTPVDYKQFIKHGFGRSAEHRQGLVKPVLRLAKTPDKETALFFGALQTSFAAVNSPGLSGIVLLDEGTFPDVESPAVTSRAWRNGNQMILEVNTPANRYQCVILGGCEKYAVGVLTRHWKALSFASQMLYYKYMPVTDTYVVRIHTNGNTEIRRIPFFVSARIRTWSEGHRYKSPYEMPWVVRKNAEGLITSLSVAGVCTLEIESEQQ
jgi:hypothetical protein